MSITYSIFSHTHSEMKYRGEVKGGKLCAQENKNDRNVEADDKEECLNIKT